MSLLRLLGLSLLLLAPARVMALIEGTVSASNGAPIEHVRIEIEGE